MKTAPWITLTVLGALALALSAASIALASGNRSLQAQLAQRQQYVQQSLQLEGLYREIVRALAELATRNSDAELKALLGQHGISVNTAAPAAPAAPADGARK